MNAPMLSQPVALRVADLGDSAERGRIAAFVHDRHDGTPFHLPEWSVAVEKGCGQKAHYLVAEKADGEIAGVMPLTHCKSPLFGSVLVSAGFGVGGGILADSRAAETALATAAWELAGKLGCSSMEVRGGASPGPEWTMENERYLGFVRPLAADDDAEMAAIPRKQRAEVRRSFTFDLDVSTGRSADDAKAHYGVYAEMVRNLGTPVFPRALFTEVLREFGTSADLLIVRHRGVAVSSVLSLYWKGTVYPYWGGGTAAARGLRANDRMYFELMRHARERGCTRFDFGRSKTGTGPAAYKKNWGFQPEPLTYYERTAEGASARDASPLNPKYRMQIAVWQKLPLWIANRAGPLISRGLG
jgi:FemAB-related protein (PEP-CTERM system-associated)